MNENRTTQLICIGAVAGAFGVHGQIKVKPFTGDPKAVTSYGPLLDENGNTVLTPGKKTRLAKAFVVISAAEVKNRDQAEALKSTKLYIHRSALPAPGEDEFYYTDLIGLPVETTEGEPKGKIKAIHNFGGGDLLEIQSPHEKDWYHPFTKLAVPTIDIKGGRVIIDIVEADPVERSDENPHIKPGRVDTHDGD